MKHLLRISCTILLCGFCLFCISVDQSKKDNDGYRFSLDDYTPVKQIIADSAIVVSASNRQNSG